MALVAAMFAGCVKENTSNVEDDGYVYEKGTIAFSLPAAGKKVTYTRADALPSEEALDNLVIYQFDENDYLEKVYATGNISIPGAGTITISGSDNTNRIARINIGTNASGKRTFYLVANVNGATNSAQSDGLWSNGQQAVPAIGTSIGMFEAALQTNNLTDALALACPLPMSNEAADVTTKGIVVTTVQNPGYQEVTLKRRVARFDIVNHKDYTKFTVTGVVVKNGNLSGKILDAELAPYTPSTGDGETGDLTATANGTASLDNGDYVDHTDPDQGLEDSGWEKSLNVAQFYLYPTTVTTTAGTTNTEIYLTGEFNGKPHVYPLTLSAGDVDIDANFVYQIIVERVGEVFRFALLKVAPWDDYNDSTIKSGLSDEFEISDLLDASDLSKGDNYDFSDVSTAEELHVVVKSMSPPVVNFAPVDRGDGVPTDGDVLAASVNVNTETPSLETRAFGPSVYYKTVITITLSGIQPNNNPARGKLTIAHPEIPTLKREYTLSTAGRYAGSATLKPVLVGGRYWAPVNAGATTLVTDFSNGGGTPIPMTSDNVGFYYQWGRNTGFWPGTFTTITNQFSDITDADNSPYFYTGTGHYLTSNDYDLWSDARSRAQGPCPTGWRVPTRGDYENSLLGLGTHYVNTVTKTVEYQGANPTEILSFPASGYINVTGSYYNDILVPVWTSTGYNYANDIGNFVSWSDTTPPSPTTSSITVVRLGFPVRCILANQ
jgi:hypothetical protein